jgi:hypothetical protein
MGGKMARLIAPQGVQGIDVRTPRGVKKYDRDKQGIINVDNPAHIRQMKSEGMFEASLMGANTDRQLGFTCSECGFGSWFRKCSRCGHENESPVQRDGGL